MSGEFVLGFVSGIAWYVVGLVAARYGDKRWSKCPGRGTTMLALWGPICWAVVLLCYLYEIWYERQFGKGWRPSEVEKP